MPTLGQREEVTFKDFRGVALQPGIYPEVVVPQDLVGDGLLLDGRNLRYSHGRAYWHRNQMRAKSPGGISLTGLDCAVVSLTVTGGNLCTVVTATPHGLLAGELCVLTNAGGAPDFNGQKTVLAFVNATTFTYTVANFTNPSALGGTCHPTRVILAYEYVSDSYNQLICQCDDGTLRYKSPVWSEAPVQWAYGYQQFNVGAYSSVLEGNSYSFLPTYSIRALANMRNNLLMAAGAGTGFPVGMPMKCWNGAVISDVGLRTPTAKPNTTVDGSGAGNLLDNGTYSYRIAFANDDYESMPGQPADAVVKAAPATGYVEPKTTTTALAHRDSVTIDGTTYRFVSPAAIRAAGGTLVQYDVPLDEDATNSAAQKTLNNWQNLAQFVYAGISWTLDGITVYTPPLQNCDVYWSYPAGGLPRIWFYAKTAGYEGNSIAISESTGAARITKSGATLSGGVGLANIDLTAIPKGPTGTTKRIIYRAYTTGTAAGSRGTDYNYIGTIDDNTATTFQDNTPPGDAGEPPAFDHAIPPHGDILAAHKDRLWMAGVCQTSESYRKYAQITATGANNDSNVTTITTTAPHGFKVGDVVTLDGITQTILNGVFVIEHVPTPTTFNFGLALSFTQPPYYVHSGNGYVSVGDFGSSLSNTLFYSELDEPYYWPAANQITVGGSNPIVGLISWHDQLLILKSDSAWLLTGYGESDWNLVQIPGIKGASGNHVASSPYGVMFAAHNGWVLWDGQQGRTIIEFQDASAPAGEVPTIAPPAAPGQDDLRAPAICYHGERFHLWSAAGFVYSWHPETDTWEIARRNISPLTGLRAFSSSVTQSHILAVMSWGSLDGTKNYLTMLDSLYRPAGGTYGDSAGTTPDDFYGEVNVELAPVVAPTGELVNPLEMWVNGQWTKPGSDSDDLKLEIYRAGAWVSIGTVTANGRLGIPGGYATGRLRLRLHGLKCPLFVLQSVRLVFQRRAARG
ncbi:MAG: hypothetical protein ACYC63_16905 [Armatimonadota bacterium]